MTRTLTRRGLFGAAGALLVAPAPLPNLHAAYARGTVTGRMSSSQPNVSSVPRSAGDGRWVWHSGSGFYSRANVDGSLDIFKTRAMGPTCLTFEVMPKDFAPWA